MFRILVINPGSTSTKTAIFEDKNCVDKQSLSHSTEILSQNSTARQQIELRKNSILDWMKKIDISLKDIDAFAIRGCNIKSCIHGGTYLVNDKLISEILNTFDLDGLAPHAARLTVPIAISLCEEEGVNKPMYITDPPSVNELSAIAKIAGHPLFTRNSVFHALNSKATAYQVAEELGKSYKQCKFVVAHMGGGVSVSAHNFGRVTEANECTGGSGAFSPNRAGTLPGEALVKLCFSGEYTQSEIIQMLKAEGGFLSYLGTADMREVEKLIEQGDEKAELVFNAMAYQIAKEIGSCYVSLSCEVDAIILTGGMANSERLVNTIRQYVESLGLIKVIPGEFENEALALGALRVLTNEEKPIVI